MWANYIYVKNEDKFFDTSVEDEKKKEFEKFWEHYKDNIMAGRNRIISSFCPFIYGAYPIKLSIILMLLGGVAKSEAGIKVRGEIHILLVGDPGTGKSQFLRYAARLSPRAVLTTGVGTTNAGLTVTAVKDSGEWHLEAGALVLADRGICCIDEFGGIKENDKTAIHEAMEQQTLSVAKAGLICKLNTRCSILAATNPKGKYDPDQSITVNIALGSPLLSRFDVVFVLLDKQDKDWDRKVSSFVIKENSLKSRKKAFVASQNKKDYTSNLISDYWKIEDLQAYILCAKSFSPKMTKEAQLVLSKYYQLQRQSDLRNAARTTIRLLESLIRLSQAHAKLMFRDLVLVQDAVVVISIIEISMQSSSIFGDVLCTLHSIFPEDPMKDYYEKERIILDKLQLMDLYNGPEFEIKPETKINLQKQESQQTVQHLSQYFSPKNKQPENNLNEKFDQKNNSSKKSKKKTNNALKNDDNKPPKKKTKVSKKKIELNDDNDEENDILNNYNNDNWEDELESSGILISPPYGNGEEKSNQNSQTSILSSLVSNSKEESPTNKESSKINRNINDDEEDKNKEKENDNNNIPNLSLKFSNKLKNFKYSKKPTESNENQHILKNEVSNLSDKIETSSSNYNVNNNKLYEDTNEQNEESYTYEDDEDFNDLELDYDFETSGSSTMDSINKKKRKFIWD